VTLTFELYLDKVKLN